MRQGLARSRPELKPVPLLACFNLLLRPMIQDNFSVNGHMRLFVEESLTIPAFVLHLQRMSTPVNLNHMIFNRVANVYKIE